MTELDPKALEAARDAYCSGKFAWQNLSLAIEAYLQALPADEPPVAPVDPSPRPWHVNGYFDGAVHISSDNGALVIKVVTSFRISRDAALATAALICERVNAGDEAPRRATASGMRDRAMAYNVHKASADHTEAGLPPLQAVIPAITIPEGWRVSAHGSEWSLAEKSPGGGWNHRCYIPAWLGRALTGKPGETDG